MPIKNKPIYIISGLIVQAVLVAIDQFTKKLAVDRLYDGRTVWLIKDVLCFKYLENTGAAFSVLEGKQTFFLIFTPLVFILVFIIFIRLYGLKKAGPMQLVCIFVIAGGIGNYIDRASQGYVVDFIYFSLIDFPIFNVADIYVTCGIFAMILLMLFYYKEEDFALFQLIPKKKEK